MNPWTKAECCAARLQPRSVIGIQSLYERIRDCFRSLKGFEKVKRRRVQIALLLAAGTLISVAGGSFLRGFDCSVSTWDGVTYHLTIRDGNLRIIRTTAASVAWYIGESPLDQHTAQQRRKPTKAFRWNSETRTLSDTTRVTDTTIGLTLFAPAALAIFAVAIAIPLVRQPSQARLLLSELWRPSNRRTVGRWMLGWCRRGALAVSILVAGLFAIVWAQSHGLLSGLWKREYAVGQIRIHPWLQTVTIGDLEALVDPSAILRTEHGMLSLVGYLRVPKAWPQPVHRFEFGSFRWRASLPRPLQCGLGLPPITPAKIVDFGKTNPVLISASAPLWAPTTLFFAWPLWAFFRGPWRRSSRRAKGICLHCSYNLTGLTEPRCPECGTGFDRSDRLGLTHLPERAAAQRNVGPMRKHRFVAR